MSFAIKLKKARQERNLTQKELSEKIEVATGVIGDIERGSRNPSANVAVKLADFFNTNIEYWRKSNDSLDTEELQEKLTDIYNMCSGLDFVTTRGIMKELINKGLITKKQIFSTDLLPEEFHKLILNAVKADVCIMFIQKDLNCEIQSLEERKKNNNLMEALRKYADEDLIIED